MRTAEDRRERLAKFIDLAKVYRGWSRGEVSRALGRDAGKLLPESGNPKLDLIVGLADALDWSVGDVIDGVWTADTDQKIEGDYALLDTNARAAHGEGKFRQMLAIANQMRRIATTPSEQALAANRMAGAYDGLGQYNKSVPCLQAALAERGIPSGLRLMLTVNLANAHYSMWNLTESRAAAHEVLELLEATTMTERRERVCHAFAHYVRGNSFRRMIVIESDLARIHAQHAHNELVQALKEYEDLADTFADERYAAIANTCRGGLLEVGAVLGEMTPGEVLERLTVALDRVVDVAIHEPGDWLESWGWWCIFGCNVALRHFPEDVISMRMAIFTNKAMEIADRLENWSLRERAFHMDLERHQRLVNEPWVLDDEEVRIIAGTMGRFPNFRAAGWRILNEARFVNAEGGARWLGA
ncbi:MAG: hypothetical protein EXS12_01495 [Phycisphaerales bacterium]|nr:hypothetical protein [Phycisphaerales bacterium]